MIPEAAEVDPARALVVDAFLVTQGGLIQMDEHGVETEPAQVVGIRGTVVGGEFRDGPVELFLLLTVSQALELAERVRIQIITGKCAARQH